MYSDSFEHLRDVHDGEIAIIIGNGLSLKTVPLSFLQKYPSFGANRISLLDGFTPTYYVCINALVVQQNTEEINRIQSIKFVRAGMIKDCYQLHVCNCDNKIFSYTPYRCLYEGNTVTYVSMQLAYFMGFTTVLLVGCDHRFIQDGVPNQELLMTGDDPNHFSPEYFKGQRWLCADLTRSAEAYQVAKEAYEKDYRRIINLTEGSDLTVFEIGNVCDWS